MATNSETGHAKNVANFETMISRCTGYGEIYNPSNQLITIEVVRQLHIESKADLNRVSVAKSPYDGVEGQRKTIFKGYKSLGTQIMGSLKSSGAPATVIADAETINRKIQGRRAPGTRIQNKEDGTPKDRISVSQQSYDMKIEHFDKLIELLAIESKYRPNEIKLKVDSLREYKRELETINSEVKRAYVPYSNAMNARNTKLYDPETGLVARAKLIKNYVRSIYKTQSPEYKIINSLLFKSLVKIK